jgi:hypothetical protein
MLIFRRYQVNSKEIKCPFQWWTKHETIFPRVGFLTSQIVWIVGSQIETERIYSLTKIFTNLRRHHLQVEILERLIF